jgi:hypothetical protein
MRWTVCALVCLAMVARAHSPSSGEVIAAAAGATGVERAERDQRNPRLLLVRVGPAWFGQPAGARAAAVADWHADWRHAVPQGVVAVLDARTDRPVR